MLSLNLDIGHFFSKKDGFKTGLNSDFRLGLNLRKISAKLKTGQRLYFQTLTVIAFMIFTVKV